VEGTFGFVDLAGFSALTEAHGDQAAADLALRFTRLVEDALAGEGRLVKTVGDAALVVAPHPDAALDFAARLWCRVAAEPDFPDVRAGLHHGEAVERDGDVFGAAVNLAARVAARAHGGEVLATARVADAARARGIDVTALGPTVLHNVRDPVPLFALALAVCAVPPVVDPVCRMRVDPERAAGRLRVKGVDHWFCSLRCAALFAEHPEAYLRR
jgi:class 3 adenylate cyclase/YHS domain-containing protein